MTGVVVEIADELECRLAVRRRRIEGYDEDLIRRCGRIAIVLVGDDRDDAACAGRRTVFDRETIGGQSGRQAVDGERQLAAMGVARTDQIVVRAPLGA